MATSLGFDVAIDCASITTMSAAGDVGEDDPTSGASDVKRIFVAMVGVMMLVQNLI